LTWNERETIAAVASLLEQAEKIEITLPADYNHALFRTLNPEAPDSALEELDVRSGPGLLTDIAGVRGLERLAALTGILEDAHASVQLLSPPTLVIHVPAPQT
jgi:hypothetical protein